MAVVQPDPKSAAGVPVDGVNFEGVDGAMIGDEFEDMVDGEQFEGAEDQGAEEEEILVSNCDDSKNSSFEQTVMELELIMMDTGFNERVGAFLTAHCQDFEEGDENKLVYTQRFEEYTEMLETYIEEQLGQRVPGFDMTAFCTDLLQKKDSVDADLDTLGAFGDFSAFKEMMLACKRGKSCDEAGGGPLCVTGAQLHVHTEEQEDGVAMPDLNLSISAVAAGPS